MTTITPDLERMARALHLRDLKRDFPELSSYTIVESAGIWRQLGPAQAHWIEDARAALESLMDLSEEAQLAGAAAESWMADDSEGLTVWQAINRYIREGK